MSQVVRIKWGHDLKCWRTIVTLKVHFLGCLPSVNLNIIDKFFDSFGFYAFSTRFCGILTSFNLKWEQAADHWSSATFHKHALTLWNFGTNQIKTCPIFIKLDVFSSISKIFHGANFSVINFTGDRVKPWIR